MAALTGPTLIGAALAVMLVRWAALAAHTVVLVSEARTRPYITMLPILGTGPGRTMTHYVLPAVLPTLVRHAVLCLPGTVLAIAGLGFLGLGASPPTPEWGLILSRAVDYAERAPWAAASSASALVLVGILAVCLSSLPPRAPKTESQRIDLAMPTAIPPASVSAAVSTSQGAELAGSLNNGPNAVAATNTASPPNEFNTPK